HPARDAGCAGGRHRRGLDRPVHRRADRGDPRARPGARRRLPARLARAAAAVAGPRRARRPRLRDPGGHQVRGGAGPLTPAHAAAGGVAAAPRPGGDPGRGRGADPRAGGRGGADLPGCVPGRRRPLPLRRAAERLSVDEWVPTRAFGRAILVTGLLVFVAVLTGRFDLVVIAAPFALGTALSLCRRPAS